MSVKIKLNALQGVFLGLSAAARCVFERLRVRAGLYKIVKSGLAVVLAACVLAAYSVILCRWQHNKDMRIFSAWADTYEARQKAVAQAALESDPYTLQLNAEAEMLARVLYGVRDNSTDDLKTLCWCAFNRVDNPAFPNTLAAVIDTPKQWMGYSAGNPVLESLYQIAREQLEAWHGDGHRPVANTFVFMSWAPDDICLRDQWTAGSGTKYWRFGQ